VANTLKLHRNGAVGFIDWLGDCRHSRCAVLPEERIEVEVAWRAACDAVLP
jgi:hypothetical protein